MISFSILTLGCKVNSYESEALINKLLDFGYELKNFNDICDVYIVNSCTVTKTSDQKSRQMLHAARRKNPNAVIAVMGCYSQLNQEEASSIADIIIGTNNKLDVVEMQRAMKYLEGTHSFKSFTKTDEERENIKSRMELTPNSVLFIVADKEKCAKLAGMLRNKLGTELDLIDKNTDKILTKIPFKLIPTILINAILIPFSLLIHQ